MVLAGAASRRGPIVCRGRLVPSCSKKEMEALNFMAETMRLKKKWRCTVCGYVCDDYEPPESCPECYAPREAFVEET